MKAYRCDRCGTLFGGYDRQGTCEFYNITRNPCASGSCLNLCPNCNAEVQESKMKAGLRMVNAKEIKHKE